MMQKLENSWPAEFYNIHKESRDINSEYNVSWCIMQMYILLKKLLSLFLLDVLFCWWYTYYPSNGTVQDLVFKFREYLQHKLTSGDVYLIFSIYNDLSTKNVTRSDSTTEAYRVDQLSQTTLLAPQKVVLSVTDNRKLLIESSVLHLTSKQFHLQHTRIHTVITG